MTSIQKVFNTNIGYSDHTLGIEIPIAAIALGQVIKTLHFRWNGEGPDHSASLEPNELFLMVKSIRNIEMALSGMY